MSLFQSTLPRRERLSSTFHGHYHLYFNPRSREGSDVYFTVVDWLTPISIHAPAKGATRAGSGIAEDERIFQSTLPRRERHVRCFNATKAYQFQSTLPRRERRIQDEVQDYEFLFQSTLPRRERLLNCSFRFSVLSFQSTLPRRERHFLGQQSVEKINFNPRSREGSDWNIQMDKYKNSNFNPRSREGSDNIILLNTMLLQKFQSTLPRRERPGIMRYIELLLYFNPRSREGSDKERYRQE